MKDWLSIGQFAKKIGTTPKALRMYEAMELLVPHTREENGYRAYHTSQVARGLQLREFKAFGFSLKEIKIMLAAEDVNLVSMFEKRLEDLSREIRDGETQKSKIKSLLTSLRKQRPLTADERRSVMKQFESMCVVVTGTDDLMRTGELIAEHLERAGKKAAIVEWPLRPTSNPCILVVRESDLESAEITTLRPDVVVVRNVSGTSKALQESYVRLFNGVGPAVSTIFNADDRASIELAAHPTIRKGKIFYFSKNAGVEDQIRKIGGVVSDGEEIRMYGFNAQNVNVPIEKVMTFGEEVALISSLAAILDVGMTLP